MSFINRKPGTLFKIYNKETKKAVLTAFDTGDVEGLDSSKYAVINYWPVFHGNIVDEEITALIDEGVLQIPGPILGTRYEFLKYLSQILKP